MALQDLLKNSSLRSSTPNTPILNPQVSSQSFGMSQSTPQTTVASPMMSLVDSGLKGIDSAFSKKLPTPSPSFNLASSTQSVASAPATTVRKQDFKDVGNLPLELSKSFTPLPGLVSLAEVVLKKPIALNAPFPHMDESNKPVEEPLRGAQSEYFNQIEKGIPESQAFANVALRTIWDMAVLAPTIKSFSKLALMNSVPEKLITNENIISATRQQMRDFSQGVATDNPIPKELQEAFRAAPVEVKKNILTGSGMDLVKAKPSLLGKMFGVTEADINNILSGARVSPAGALPGQRDVPGQAPAFGLSTRKVENVGYGENDIAKIALAKDEGDIADVLSKNVDFPAEKIPLVSKILVGLNDPRKIQNVLDGVISKPEKIKYSAEGIPLSTAKAEARLAQNPLPDLPPIKKIQPKFVSEPEIPVPKSISGLLQRNLSPLKYVDEGTAKDLRTWNAERITGREMANQTAESIKIPDDSMELIHKYQAGENIPQAPEIKKIFDDLRKEAIARGVDVKEIPNYVPQVYKGTPSEIQGAILKYLSDHGVNDEMAQDYIKGVKPLSDEMAKRLKLSPNFEKERVFANYKTAEEYGLKPKYDKVSDLAAYYRDELNKAVANKRLITNLVEKGKIMPTASAPKDWIPLNNQFSNSIHYSAPANTAKVINDIFANPDLAGLGARIVHVGATVSKFAQEVALSGGLPNTDINFFAIGQLVKEVTAGNFKAISSFIKANSNSATIKFFNEHKNTLIDMAEQGIDISNRTGSFNQKSLVELIESKEFKKAIGHGLDAAFGKKTFESFIPMMQVQLFEDVSKAAIKKGLSPEEAKNLAGDTLRKNFGLNTDAFAQSRTTQDTLSAGLFAPRFRESIIKTLFNTGKAGADFIYHLGGLNGPVDPSLTRNRRLLLGMILSFGIYDAINRELNDGDNMWDNPVGHEFDIRIPTENGEVIYVGFMPSFLAFARNTASGLIAVGHGDLKTAGQKFGSLLSMPLKITSEILTNSDYFGNDIYKDNDTSATKAKKIAGYIGLQVNHPYVKEAVNQIEEKKPLYQSIITALELPLKFSTKEKESTTAFYNALDNKAKETARTKEKFAPTFNEIQNLIRDGKIDEAKSMVKSLTNDQYDLYKSMKASLKTSDTFSGKAKMYDTYNVVQDLIKQGKQDQAKTIIDSLSSDEYKYYKLLKKQFGDKKAAMGDGKSLISKIVENTIGVKTASAAEMPTQSNDLNPERIKNEIAFRESGTSTTPYNTVNSKTNDYGKYQVNKQTLADYSKKFLGKVVSVQEFLKSPALQEKFMEEEIRHLQSFGAKSLDAFLILHHRGWGDVSAKRVSALKQDPEVKHYINNKRK